MKFIVIGITDAPQPFFPPEVADIIRCGEVFSGGKRHHDIVAPLLPDGAQWIDITVPLDAVLDRYRQLFDSRPDATIIVFASGDPLFFGFANTLRREMSDARLTVYPVFNSLQLLSHRLLMPYHDMRIVSLTGRPWHEFDRALIERTPLMGVLTDRQHTPQTIAERMTDYGYTYYNIYIGEHLGHPEHERISRLTLTEAAGRTFDQPNCLILKANDEQRLRQRPFGIPDRQFTLLDGRERMITKMPIRLLSLQALELSNRRCLWDIGFCTGSISIEARLQFPHVEVVAFEVRPEGEHLISENSRRFGAPGITALIGDFLSADISGLPRPDAVFIGGHGGKLKEIMKRVLTVLLPGGIIVMNSVTPQSRALFAEACSDLHLQAEDALHIAINDYHPIDIMKCRR